MGACRGRSRSQWAACAIAALGLAAPPSEAVATSAVTGPPPSALRLVLPSAGILFGAPRDRTVVSTDTALITFSVAHGPDAQGREECPLTHRERTPVQVDGWLTLSLETDAGAAEAYRTWLDAPSAVADADLTHRELLQRIWRALAVGIDALRGIRARPENLEFVVHVVPANCVSSPRVVHTPEQALQRVSFPLAFHAPAMLEPEFASTLLWYLVEVASHETVHLIQDHPFSRAKLEEIRRIGGLAFERSGQHASMAHELHARMVDRCLRQAVLPNDWNGDRVAQMWRDRRASFWAHAAGDPFARMYDELFRRQQRILGRHFVNTTHEHDLQTLFGWCAMYLRKGPPVPSTASPTRADVARGSEALRRIREVTPPLRFRSGLYGDHSLP